MPPEEYKSLLGYQSIQRAKKTIRRLINANAGQYYEGGKEIMATFLTLTFAKNRTDLDTCNLDYKNFVKRLNYHVFGSKKNRLKYLTVVEFQKRGAIHYHSVFFNLKFIPVKEIESTWGHGFVKINGISHVDNIGSYITKYLGKGIRDSRLEGRKAYFTSRGMIKPIELKDKKEIHDFLAGIPKEHMDFESDFDSEYLGRVRFSQYNLNKSLK